ncbi:MAG TPA: hypothetical protein ENG20_05965 [Methanomicrobia archaeon]|nr:hypothetical protein [Methanomicrobia archaeon]
MRYRWMYYATGMPGWMRFGFSPGWVGRSPTGLPPAAQYLMQTGQMPQFAEFLGTQMPFYQGMALSKDQEISMLENQAKLIEQQLEQIKKRLEELRK